MPQPSIRRKKTYPLRLTPYELVHLRDLFSVLLPTEANQTVSQALAAAEDRAIVEARLWQRIAAACKEAGVPTDDDAPDFVVTATAAPPVGVFRIAESPVGTVDEDDDDEAGPLEEEGPE